MLQLLMFYYNVRSANSLAGADIGSAHDLVSESPPHGLTETVEKKMLLLRKAISQTFAMPCTEEICQMPKEDLRRKLYV